MSVSGEILTSHVRGIDTLARPIRYAGGAVPAAGVGLRYVCEVASIAETVLAPPLFDSRVLNVVTLDWRRFDISFIEPGELGRFDAVHLVPLVQQGRPRSTPKSHGALPGQT